MDDPVAIAKLVMEKDDKYSDAKIQSVRHLMIRARLTQEGVYQLESEIRLYESSKEFNKILVTSENEALMRANAIKILYRMISETEIPSWKEREARKNYQKIIDEYSQYLRHLHKH
ncbi:MAG: hypothetical protein AAFX01_03155 [Cyanobacteria bacterium J06638_28]